MKEILVRAENCLGCKSCELACAVAHSESKTLFGAVLETPKPQLRVFVEGDGVFNFPLQCRQCADRPCVHACMAGAMYLDEETGLVQLDSGRCVGCWMCVMVCPFGVIAQGEDHRAVKCDRCRDSGYRPACVEACPTKALQFVPVSQFTRSGRKSYLAQIAKEVV